jgi:hypothetical protein
MDDDVNGEVTDNYGFDTFHEKLSVGDVRL